MQKNKEDRNKTLSSPTTMLGGLMTMEKSCVMMKDHTDKEHKE